MAEQWSTILAAIFKKNSLSHLVFDLNIGLADNCNIISIQTTVWRTNLKNGVLIGGFTGSSCSQKFYKVIKEK